MNWRRVIQLACIHVGVSITVVPVMGTLNRIMIADFGWSALWVSLLVSLPYLLSPLQVLIGSWADHYPIGGRHRAPWIVLGGLMASFGSYFTAHAAYYAFEHPAAGAISTLGAFIVWGMGVNIASVSYLSLVTELSDGQPAWRNRVVSIMWAAMILSSIGVSLTLSVLLSPFSQEALHSALGMVWLISSLLVLVGAGNLEPRGLHTMPPQNRADNPLRAYALLASNPSARRFFIYLLIVLISIHAQDVLLEPFGAEVLAMPVSQTTRLASIWGAGVFITLIGGLALISRLGKKRAANLGALVAAGAFVAISISGLLDLEAAFMLSIFVLGLGGGLMTVSNLSFMLDMTVPQAAGLYMGAWGVANFAGQAVGNLVSGLIRDVVLALTGNPAVGYIAVFILEGIGLLVAVYLFRRVSVEEFRRDAQVQLSDVLAIAAD